MSRLDLIVGPNGAGKTTFVRDVILAARPGLPFVNADQIAHSRWPGDAETMSYEAARIAADTREALLEARLDFAAETVFSHPSKVELVDRAITAGFDVVLHVVMIPKGLSAARVAARVAAGGHNVPAEKLGPRWERIWPLVAEALPKCSLANFEDNSHDLGPVRVATFRSGVPDTPPRWPSWTPTALLSL